MSATFDDAALIEDEDKVGFADRAESMGYNKRSPALEESFEGALEARFGNTVDGARGFVQNEKARIDEQGAGETDELALAHGKVGAFLAYLRPQPVGECVDQIQAIQCL